MGYTFDGFTGDCNASGSVTVPAGGNVTCTLTNNDDTPQLKLVKIVDANDGGGATAADFTLSANAPGNPLSRNFSSTTASPIFHNVAAGRRTRCPRPVRPVTRPTVSGPAAVARRMVPRSRWRWVVR